MDLSPTTAAERAVSQVAAVRDSPQARLRSLAETYRGPTGRAPQHLPFRRAALSFMGWQLRRRSSRPRAWRWDGWRHSVIAPRLQHLYEWSAEALAQPDLLELIDEGNPTYAWSPGDRGVWAAPARQTRLAGLLGRATDMARFRE
jgi:hypothetical protein